MMDELISIYNHTNYDFRNYAFPGDKLSDLFNEWVDYYRMFGTTYYGSQIHPKKSFLIPCLQDESYAYMDIYKNMFQNVAGLIFHAFMDAAFDWVADASIFLNESSDCPFIETTLSSLIFETSDLPTREVKTSGVTLAATALIILIDFISFTLFFDFSFSRNVMGDT